MNLLIKYLKSRKILLVIVLIYFLVRLPFINRTFLSRDERDMALTGYSIAKTGNDLFGNRLPLHFERISPKAPLIPIYYDALWWKLPLTRTVFTSRLAFALPASFLPLLLFELVYIFTKKKNIAFLTSLIFCFSPWIFNISLMGLEINLALPLLLTAMIFQLKRKKKTSYFFYFLAFFTYQGFQPLEILIPPYLEFFEYFSRLQTFKKALFSSAKYLLLFLVLIFASIIIEKNIGTRSSSEIILLDTVKSTQIINFSRNISSGPNILKTIFDNKLTLSINYVVGNLFKGLDFSYLFKLGDYAPEYNNGVAGQFFSVFFIFFIFGLPYLYHKKRLDYYFLAGLSLIGMVPSLVDTYSLTFSIRSSLAAAGFSFIIAGGIIFGYEITKKLSKHIRLSAILFVIFIMVFESSSFFYHFYFTRPTLYSEIFNEKERRLSEFLYQTGKSYTIKASEPYSAFMSYLFLSDIDHDFNQIAKMLKNNYTAYTFKNARFEDCQIDPHGNLLNKKIILDELCVSGPAAAIVNNNKNTEIRFIYYSYSSEKNYILKKRVAYYIFN